MNSLFIYNAEAETDILLESFPATLLFIERMSEGFNGQAFNDLLHATFQLRSDLVPSNTQEYEQVLDDCIARAHQLTYTLIHMEKQEQPIAERVYWRNDSLEVLKAILERRIANPAHDESTDEDAVIIISLGVFRPEPYEEQEDDDAFDRFISVDITNYEPDNHQKYRQIGFDRAQSEMDTMQTLLEAGKLD